MKEVVVMDSKMELAMKKSVISRQSATIDDLTKSNLDLQAENTRLKKIIHKLVMTLGELNDLADDMYNGSRRELEDLL